METVQLSSDFVQGAESCYEGVTNYFQLQYPMRISMKLAMIGYEFVPEVVLIALSPINR